MINVHPQRWNDEFIPWASELVRQRIKNVVKKLMIRRTDLPATLSLARRAGVRRRLKGCREEGKKIGRSEV